MPGRIGSSADTLRWIALPITCFLGVSCSGEQNLPPAPVAAQGGSSSAGIGGSSGSPALAYGGAEIAVAGGTSIGGGGQT